MYKAPIVNIDIECNEREDDMPTPTDSLLDNETPNHPLTSSSGW